MPYAQRRRHYVIQNPPPRRMLELSTPPPPPIRDSPTPLTAPPPLIRDSPVLLDGFITVSCPDCFGIVIIHPTELNCKIVRHGVFILNGQPIPPHASKAEIDQWQAQGVIRGCGIPFRIVGSAPNFVAEKCGYI